MGARHGGRGSPHTLIKLGENAKNIHTKIENFIICPPNFHSDFRHSGINLT